MPPSQVKKLVVTILARGTVAFTGHAYEEMRKDGLVETDVVNVLRGGAYKQGEYENSDWRYRVVTARICVIVAFRSATYLVVVTAWRLRER